MLERPNQPKTFEQLSENIINTVKSNNFNKSQIESLVNKLQNLITEEISSLDEVRENEGYGIKEKRQAVIDILRKNQDKIIGFNFGTNTGTGYYKGNWATSEKKENYPVQYDSRYNDEFEIIPLNDSSPVGNMLLSGNERPYYIFDKPNKRLTFNIPLGRVFADDRAGNHYDVTLVFKKDDREDKTEIFNKISELLKTLHYYYGESVKIDRYKIAKQGLPVLEAFDEISKMYQDGNLSIDQIIEEYKMTIKEYEKTT